MYYFERGNIVSLSKAPTPRPPIFLTRNRERIRFKRAVWIQNESRRVGMGMDGSARRRLMNGCFYDVRRLCRVWDRMDAVR